ncbi:MULTISPECIES: SDR family NAD(P)-dependent oxidoreductase [unclassified Microbacterium]|uniref:SDR family NAD(P)-dependent oxidoreductase n=1 Tax=unclassified Microbacterium TaxID=2609290 RepID=UPI000CFB379D|nr:MULTISPECIES: SDR family NAD(P)-dependent oxidoreductase [unclassified Microbacterium]PQZ50863.1 short-chain dehydrogenase [Microbacterium sp. MYb43]PQZ73220.1 short-chain dehydrogenase [Microbacterium sp. MYb40]PRB15084.1 short-chain dehydrogenase [Microbacterium sp. MYb54]PRB21985.1 short-chain dehydrogenase [Microbacterium sp. MYb50]PRB59709.1 short-chain dehydrogenase [Microbacterium sp. MYb24]
MTAQTIIITGASDGIGAAAARQLASSPHRLILIGRSVEKTHAVADETGAEWFTADFARLDDVRELAGKITDAVGDDGIHVLANNAGGIFGDRTPTVDGFEKTMQVNHLAPFLLTNLLLPQLLQAEGTVINTSSIAHRLFGHLDVDDLDNSRRFSPNKAYGDAKLANVLFAKSLHTKFHAQGLSAVAFHPGTVRTNFAAESSSIMRLLYRTPLKHVMLIGPDKGGATLRWFIEGTPDETWFSGGYYDERQLTTKVNPQVNDADLAESLWQRSIELVGLPSH